MTVEVVKAILRLTRAYSIPSEVLFKQLRPHHPRSLCFSTEPRVFQPKSAWIRFFGCFHRKATGSGSVRSASNACHLPHCYGVTALCMPCVSHVDRIHMGDTRHAQGMHKAAMRHPLARSLGAAPRC